MTKKELFKLLTQLKQEGMNDPETAHIAADKALLAYIGDSKIAALHDELASWCA